MGAAPIIGAAIADIATGIGEPHQRVVAVHLIIVTVRGALRDAIEQNAGEMRAAVAIHEDALNRRLAGGQRRAIRRVNVQLVGEQGRQQDSAIRQVKHCNGLFFDGIKISLSNFRPIYSQARGIYQCIKLLIVLFFLQSCYDRNAQFMVKTLLWQSG